VSWGTLYYGFSLFVLPMRDELGWSLTLVNGALTLGLLVSAACAYPVGALIDARGGRAIMTLGSLGAGVLLVAWSQVGTPLAFYGVWLGLGAVMAAVLYEPLFIVLARHFHIEARRAVTVLTLIAGFASTVFMPLTELLLARLAWREVLVLLAACNVLIAAPVNWWLVPAAARAPAAGDEAAAPGALARRLGDPLFWGLALWFTAYAGTGSALMFQLVPGLKSLGVETATILVAVALVGPAQVGGRLLLMLGGANVPLAIVGALTTSAIPLALLVLALAPATMGWLAVFAIVFGAANGVTTIMRGVAPAEWLGRAQLGRTMGAIGAPMMLAAALGPLAAAALWSRTGDPRAMLWAIVAFSLLGAVGFWLAVAVRRRRAGDG
jgi:MFS family permease